MTIDSSKTHNIKVFLPSLGKIVSKKAYYVGDIMAHPMMVLKEEVSLYGKEATNAHTVLVFNYKSKVFHFLAA